MFAEPEPVATHNFAIEEELVNEKLKELDDIKENSDMDSEEFSVHKRKKQLILQREKTLIERRKSFAAHKAESTTLRRQKTFKVKE